MTDPAFATSFPPATRAQWRALVEKVLKDVDADTLKSKTHDGIEIEPLYDKSVGGPELRRSGPWRVLQRSDHPDPTEANVLALADLEGGADGLALVFAGAPSARGYGVDIASLDELDRALNGVMLDLIHLRVETAPFRGRHVAALVAALVERRGQSPFGLSIDFGLDPIGDMARTGASPVAWEEMADRLGDLAGALSERGFRRSLVRADARPVHEAGGSQAQELAYAVTTGLAYLRALEAHGFTLDVASEALSFLLVADADEFLTLAKFRAMRRLWARVEDACGLPPKPIRLDAETAWRMTTRRDPFVNMLRGAIAACAAGLGGADGVTVLPFTAALGLPDGFARRMARLTQLILIEESNLGRVADPAAGAGGFEALTTQLAERAWALLQRIESSGGVVTSLTKGSLQADIAKVRVERESAIAARKDPLTGTSEFANLTEAAVAVLAPAPRAGSPRPVAAALSSPAPLPALIEAAHANAALIDAFPLPGAFTCEPLPSKRDAEPFERLRDVSDERLAQTGVRPRVFLANLGPVAAFTARASFAKNFFESGGVEAMTNDGFASHDELIAAFKRSGTKLVCLCSQDDTYEAEGMAIVKALQSAGASVIYVAGRPQKFHEPLREAVRVRFIFAGCDALGMLEEAIKAG